MEIEHLNHASFRLSAKDAVVYIDPFEIPPESACATLVLVTHEHYDHCSHDDIALLCDASTAIMAPESCRENLLDLPASFTSVVPEETYEVAGVSVRAVPAYNIGKKFHPRSAGGVGYVVDIDGRTVYHAGDTDVIPEMAGLKPDVALLPVGGTYTMDAEQAAEAFKMLGAERAIPMHFGSVAGTQQDADRFLKMIGDAG